MPIRWDSQNVGRLKQLVAQGLSSEEIGRRMGVSAGQIRKMVRRHLPSATKPSPSYEPSSTPWAKRKARRIKLMRSNIEHLLDLKRAGHSPRYTEFRIDSEGIVVRFCAEPRGSLISSPAAV